MQKRLVKLKYIKEQYIQFNKIIANRQLNNNNKFIYQIFVIFDFLYSEKIDPKILDLSDLSDHPSEISQNDQEEIKKLDLDNPSKKQYKIFNEFYLLNKSRFLIVEEAINELNQLQQNTNALDKDSKQNDNKRSQAIQSGNNILSQIKTTLDDCETIIKQLREKEEKQWEEKPELYGTYSLDYRMCLEQNNQMSKTFVSICQTFTDASGSAKAAIQNRLRRILSLINNDKLDQAKINQIVENNDVGYIQMLIGSTENEYDAILNQAVEKNTVCEQINRTISEIKQMVLSQAVLIQQQSEQIDRIQNSVDMARDYVEKGVKNLVSANKQAKAHKKCICCSICLAALIAIIILIILVAVLKK